MQNKPTVSLIISTFNWPEALDLVLASVLRQTHSPDQIVIADDGSDQRTKEVIQSYIPRFKVPLVHVWQEDNGFRKSLILNKAVKQCIGDYIIEIDGDIIIHPKFIADHLGAARMGSFVQGSRTMITQPKSDEILKTKQIDFSVFSSGLYSRFNALRAPYLSWIFKIDPSNPFHIKGCNLAFWKKDFINVNGYFNGFEGWGAEDYEFGARLLHSGIKRKRLKMLAMGYHIFHPVNSRANTDQNDRIYRKTLAEKITRCDNGYQQTP